MIIQNNKNFFKFCLIHKIINIIDILVYFTLLYNLIFQNYKYLNIPKALINHEVNKHI